MPGSSNYDWAKEFFRQGCVDWFHGRELFSRVTKSQALALAQYQQAAEKAMKAGVLLEIKKRLGKDELVVLSHTIWQDLIAKEGHLNGLKQAILKAIHPLSGEHIAELENLAPHGTIDVANTEYPWEAAQGIVTPADHFAVSGLDKVAILKGVSDSIIHFMRGYDTRKLEPVFQAIKQEFERDASLTDGDTNHDRT